MARRSKIIKLPCVIAKLASLKSCKTNIAVIFQIYDPTKRWERYTIHGD